MTKIKDTGERLIPEKHMQSLTYGEHLARYRAARNLVKDKVVLDLASGAGYGTNLLSKNAKKIYGVDYSIDAINYAKSLYKNRKLEFIQGNALSIPLDDESVDVVVSLETIEHISEPEKFIKEIRRVLKPSGVLYVSTPNDDEFTEGNEYHVHEFDFNELNRLMKKYFKNYEYYYQGSWFTSGVLNKENFSKPSSEITSIKTFGQPLNKAIYFLAVASNKEGNLPKLEDNIVASDRYSELDAINLSKSINESIDKLNSENYSLKQELDSIKSSKIWRLVEKARKLKN